jgi:hypothetical protein
MPTADRPPIAPLGTLRAQGLRLGAGFCLALLGAVAPAQAQSVAAPAPVADAGPNEASLEALIQRVDQLEAEIRALRAQLATRMSADREAPVAAMPAVLTQASDPHAHAPGAASDDAAEPEPWKAPVTQIHWFSDVGVSTSDRPNTTTSFGLGQLDLFLTSALNDQWSVLSEIVFRANTDNRFVVNPERLLVQYRPTEGVQLSMGRFHSSVGYYHAAYHHGSWFETAASRPSIFGAGFIPYHSVGISARTRIPSGAAGLGTFAESGTGLASRSTTVEATQNVVDENNAKATNIGLITRPTGLPGFQAGVSWYKDRLDPTGRPSIDAGLWAGHAVYNSPRWELLNEIVAARHVQRGSSTARVSYGWYSQSAYRVGNFRPYFRYQVVQGDAADPVYGWVGHRYGPVAGLRIDISRFAAVKVHVDSSHQSATGTTTHDGVVRLAFTF